MRDNPYKVPSSHEPAPAAIPAAVSPTIDQATPGSNKVLRRTKNDLIATLAISVVALLGLGTVWLNAPVRSSELNVAAAPAQVPAGGNLKAVPNSLTEVWEADTEIPELKYSPVVASNVVVNYKDGVLYGLDPATGIEIWSYKRDVELCSIGTAWESIVATYRTGLGCGDTVALNAADGQYKYTRSSISSENVAPLQSNDRIGTISKDRVEVWRNDLVRTVEYGDKVEKQEAKAPDTSKCSLSSGLTRKELLVFVDKCDTEGKDDAYLRFEKASPKDSRVVEPLVELPLSNPNTRLVAVGPNQAAVYFGGSMPEFVSYDDKGKELFRAVVPKSPAIEDLPEDELFVPQTGDLPHSMTWFDGERLYLLNPGTLKVEQTFNDAIGTGVGLENRFLFPTEKGIAVGDWATGKVEKEFPVDRKGYKGSVALSIQGNMILERRGDKIAAIRADI